MSINKKADLELILHFMIIVMLVILLLISVYAGYIFYSSMSSEPENLSVVFSPNTVYGNQSLSQVRQFNVNMKFNHNKITYAFHDCDLSKQEKMLTALEIISNETKVITFEESSDRPDIDIFCSEKNKESGDVGSDFFIAGEGGAKEIIPTGKYNIITSGSVLLYKSPHGSLVCKTPTIELHELLHVFGFDHSSDKNSLMYPYLTSCSQTLDRSILNELTRLYSEENLPDLYFENFTSPIRRGRYLDLNFTIKNSGTTDAKNVNFSIVEDGKIIETHDLGDIRFGAGVFMKIDSLRLSSSGSQNLSVIIDLKNTIKEYDKSNNIAEVKLNKL